MRTSIAAIKLSDEWLNSVLDGMPNREAAFEELLMLWLENINPAFAPFQEFFNDGELEEKTIYGNVVQQLGDYFATRPLFAPEIGTLLDALRAPMLASPESLTGQLAFIREHWAPHLGDELKQVLLAMDTLKEEDLAIWMRFHPPSGSTFHPDRRQGWGSEGFVGDDFIGYGEEGHLERQRRLHGQAPVVHEYEAFSPDQDWMPTVVLIAKSTYVWLEQLSKKYQRHIQRLDEIPGEELSLLADRGLNGLWLIGLWERSIASQTIKRLRGQTDAVASAYSLRDYQIAADLGGEAAYRTLRDRAAARGIRLASDMVPNHMGIDSTWVMEHPEWFLSRPESPFPVYRFEGPDLSNDSRYEIKIEDHYFDQTDAAVVFRLRQRNSGHTEFVYHGNDGTTFAWNDTAQLNYAKAVVREQVMQTILNVARLFPIIRFDAAMTLAKKHVQRLWFPLPGVGGSIPSRAEFSMSNEEFDALMPNEFWREVVDRVAVEVPGTLLLAEAFWLLEGYFVRTLGMHRVYNSAFMNMLRDEENAKYRSYLKKTIEFDPDILKRYVNFMSNPDERTAVDQFGSGDRYFGVCVLLATIPGLPMFGHGQIEAFTEKYGMEYKQARYDEYPNEDLVARHQREIAPLLKNRKLFAESVNFVLYDFWTHEGTVDENVFAYSNRLGDQRAIILFNNRYGSTSGTIHTSAQSMDKASGTLRSRQLSEALHLQSEGATVIAYTDTVTGLEHLRRSRAFGHEGLTVDLRGYQYIVLQNWRELRSTAEHPWDSLCGALNGAGVYSLDEALSKLRLRPLHEALRQMLSSHCIQGAIAYAVSQRSPRSHDLWPTDMGAAAALVRPETKNARLTASKVQTTELLPATAAPPTALRNPEHTAEADIRLEPILKKAQDFIGAIRAFQPAMQDADEHNRRTEESLILALNLSSRLQTRSAAWPKTAETILPVTSPQNRSLLMWSQIVAWSVLRTLTPDARQFLEIFDQLQLRAAIAETLSALGIEGENAWRAAARIRVLLSHRPDGSEIPLNTLLARDEFWNDSDVRWLAGVGDFEGTTFFNKEVFEELLFWLALPDLLEEHVEKNSDVPTWVEVGADPLRAIIKTAEDAKFNVSTLRTLLLEKLPLQRTQATEPVHNELDPSEKPVPAAIEITAEAPRGKNDHLSP